MKGALVNVGVLFPGLHVFFQRHVSKMAWVNKGEVLSIVSPSVQSVCGLHLTLWEGLTPTAHSSSLLEQEGSCSSGTARRDSEEK